MNKKADTEISLKTLVGFILVAIIFIAFVGFFAKLWGIFLNKPNQATLNSFSNLVHELNTLEEGQPKTVPFFIQDGLYLYTECEKSFNEYGLAGKTILNDICICSKTCHDKRHIREIFKKEKIQEVKLIDTYITYSKSNEIRNLNINLKDKKATITIA